MQPCVGGGESSHGMPPEYRSNSRSSSSRPRSARAAYLEVIWRAFGATAASTQFVHAQSPRDAAPAPGATRPGSQTVHATERIRGMNRAAQGGRGCHQSQP
eukprot:3980394-Prymnesium_polylepis.3